MKNKLLIIEITLLAVFSLIWFIFIQVEYEIITKPDLQNDFPVVKGIYAVYFNGDFLIILSMIIVYLAYLIKRSVTFNHTKI